MVVVDADPEPAIRIWFHFDEWVDRMLEGLKKAKQAAG